MEHSKPVTNTVNEKIPGVFSLLKCKCPRCRRGDMFEHKNPYRLRTTMKMNKACPVCGQPFNLEVGFYYGSSYVSYAITVALSGVTLVAWWWFIGFADEKQLLYWLGANAVLLVLAQPYLMRFARTVWLAFFVRYDKNWRTNPPKRLERTNEDQEKNW